MTADEQIPAKPQMMPLAFERLSPAEQLRRARAFYDRMRQRRTVREFSPDPVPFELVELAVRSAATAPSGANQQPWRFVVVSDPEIKREIRVAAEAEEKEFYEHRAPREWLDALAPLGTDWRKPFLETAPYLIVVFRLDYDLRHNERGEELHAKNYYAQESVGIAVGMLLTALHWAGLATLTHTPSPMGFLSELLDRPKNERGYMIVPVGFPARGATVPRITKKDLGEVMVVKGREGSPV
jgi:iodotyrosine deiodinase